MGNFSKDALSMAASSWWGPTFMLKNFSLTYTKGNTYFVQPNSHIGRDLLWKLEMLYQIPIASSLLRMIGELGWSHPNHET